MTLAHNVALIALLSQHETEQAAIQTKVEPIVIRNAPKSDNGKGSKGKSSMGEKAPICKPNTAPATPGLTLPEVGTLDAAGFMKALHKAGMRETTVEFKGEMVKRMVRQPSEIRNDEIMAIAAFIGYNSREEFAGQHLAASNKANAELNPAKALRNFTTRTEERGALRSVAGYCSGLPDHKARALQNLLAREKEAVDAMIAHDKDAEDKTRTLAERTLSTGLAEAEGERLIHIREDIKLNS